jgi:excisionase family DNA binding protein
MSVTAPQVAYTLPDAAVAVGYSERHLRREIHAGRLKAKKPGREYRIGATELREWFDQLPDFDTDDC